MYQGGYIAGSFSFRSGALGSPGSLVLLPLSPAVLVRVAPDRLLKSRPRGCSNQGFLLKRGSLSFVTNTSALRVLRYRQRIFVSLGVLRRLSRLSGTDGVGS